MAPEFNTRVSGEVRAEMARQQINQTTLAGMLGWSQVAVSRRVSGQVALSTDDIERIAEVLGVEVGQLVSVPASAGT
jgi:transcriptional regulator with XRE-family HTH domain